MPITRASISRMRAAHQRVINETEQAIEAALRRGGEKGEAKVASAPGFTPRTGNLQKATEIKVVRTSRGAVLKLQNSAKYAAAIDKGARPHRITAKTSGGLRFQIGGRWIRKQSVNHPGNRPYRFLWSAQQIAGVVTLRELTARMTRIAARF